MSSGSTTAPIAAGGSTSTTFLPEIHLLCMLEKASGAFEEAVARHYPTIREHTKVTVHNSSLKYLDKNLRFDAVVSPANSYARLDGAFDDALARAYAPAGDYDWITRMAQTKVYEQWRGYAPPGTCTVIPLVEQAGAVPAGSSDHEKQAVQRKLPWSTKYLLLCPTMRIPANVTWDREVVYECIWSMLCAVDNHNRAVRQSSANGQPVGMEISSILMTPLATGVGRVTDQRWAEQCLIAMKQWVEASEKPAVWSRLTWDKILEENGELSSTYVQ